MIRGWTLLLGACALALCLHPTNGKPASKKIRGVPLSYDGKGSSKQIIPLHARALDAPKREAALPRNLQPMSRNIQHFLRAVEKLVKKSETSLDMDGAKKELATRILDPKPPSCTAEYEALGESTMCDYYDSEYASNPGVSDADKVVIVDEHNNYRAAVSPAATNMQTMVWDEEIAVIAQKYANTCPLDHDTGNQRRVPDYGIAIGQNLAMGYGSWSGSIEGWHSEVTDFSYIYGVDPDDYLGENGWKKVGHYTQVVRDIAARVGCGYADCSDSIYGNIYVCNYAFGNPYDMGRPYTNGTSCAECTASCNNNLCDCGGKICFNGGTLNPDTCQCSCTALYGDDQCETLYCPSSDLSHCGVPQPYGYTEDLCHISNVPIDCPYMCGVCSGGEGTSTSTEDGSEGGEGTSTSTEDGSEEQCPGKGSDYCQNGGALNAGCTCDCPSDYTGDQCEWLADCHVQDPSHCNTQWLPSYCDEYSNVPAECPIMCGLCPDLCPDVSSGFCQNDGQLNGDTCVCDCPAGYIGDDCKKYEVCPKEEDEWYCGSQWPESYCDKYTNVPDTCPYMCGLC